MMFDKDTRQNPLADISDEIIFRETAQRLRRQFHNERGKPFLFGSFEFVFHGGKFQWIEESPRTRRYVSEPRTPKVRVIPGISVRSPDDESPQEVGVRKL